MLLRKRTHDFFLINPVFALRDYEHTLVSYIIMVKSVEFVHHHVYTDTMIIQETRVSNMDTWDV